MRASNADNWPKRGTPILKPRRQDEVAGETFKNLNTSNSNSDNINHRFLWVNKRSYKGIQHSLKLLHILLPNSMRRTDQSEGIPSSILVSLTTMGFLKVEHVPNISESTH